MDTQLQRQRWRLLVRLTRWLETPLVLLAGVWLVLVIVELVSGLSPALAAVTQVIWIVFIIDFALRFVIAPVKLVFLRRNLLTALSLILPALRVVRLAVLLRAARGLRLVRLLSSINRGMGALGASMHRRGAPYVIAATLVVLFAGAAGMLAFERRGLSSYGEALWWTAMLLTTIGSEYWPRSSEGRALALVLSLYAVAILGYVAAALATFFVGRDAAARTSEIPSEAALRAVRQEVVLLREELKRARGTGEIE